MKSLASVVGTSSEMLKSISGNVENFGKTPQKPKGILPGTPAGNGTLNKSFEGAQAPAEGGLTISQVKHGLLKAVREDKIPGTILSRWEANRYNNGVISKDHMEIVKSYI